MLEVQGLCCNVLLSTDSASVPLQASARAAAALLRSYIVKFGSGDLGSLADVSLMTWSVPARILSKAAHCDTTVLAVSSSRGC